MNFSSPYIYPMPYRFSPINSGNIITKVFGNLKFSNIISGASKTLNFVNQTIPVIKQISPMVNNAKTMFNVLNEFKKNDTSSTNNKINTNHTIKTNNTGIKNSTLTNNSYKDITNGPVFFI